MSIKHHLTDDLLMAYSAGTLPEAFSLAVATHVTMCDECRARLASYDTIGGAVLNGADTAEVGDDALASTLALIAKGTPTPRPHIRNSAVPAPLTDYVGTSLADVKWRMVGGGVQQAILRTSKEATARLLRIPGGVSVPDHGHNGIELTLVLQGAFRDEQDRFGPGDIEVADEDLHHTPVAEAGLDCICLAVTDAPLKFNAFLPRLAQKFLRI